MYLLNVFILFLIVSPIFEQPSYSDKVKSMYLQFSNQSETMTEKATNFAILESGDLGDSTFRIFAICGSVYIGFFRSQPTFYTVRRNDHKTLWFTLSILNQDTTKEVYTAIFNYFGGSALSSSVGKLRLRPHAWSHACTTVDVESGHVSVVINGILTINTTINSKDFTGNMPTVFKDNLVLGVLQYIFIGSPNVEVQSEGSVTNINVYSDHMNVSQMEDITSTGRWTDGDIVSWSQAKWTLQGNTKEIIRRYSENTLSYRNLFRWRMVSIMCIPA